MELAFVSTIVGAFTFVWLIIHCVAATRWPETKATSQERQDVYREAGSRVFATGEVCE
jgi:hypothetical protein